MRFRVIFEYDPVAESYSAVCPELPGCASAGETDAEARQNIEEAVRLYLTPSDLDLPGTPTAVPNQEPYPGVGAFRLLHVIDFTLSANYRGPSPANLWHN